MPEPPETVPNVPRRAGRVLIVDDERAIREAIRRTLLVDGFEVLLASGGAEGLDILARDPGVALVLLDLNMPGVDGWQFREKQKAIAHLAAIPTVIVTGLADAQMHAAELQATDVLRKPFTRAQLTAMVTKYVEPGPPQRR